MTVRELTEKLSNLPGFMQELPVYVEDGFDPSDPCEAVSLRHEQADNRGAERIEIRAA